MSFVWTPANIAEATRLYVTEGYSASKVALAISAPSRSAVIGKLSRLGVRRETPSVVRFALAGSRKQSPFPSGGKRKPLTKPDRPAFEPSTDAMRIAGTFPTLGAGFGTKTIMQLGAHDCKWPDSHPKEEATAETLFCGARVFGEGCYCPAHTRLSKPTDTLARYRPGTKSHGHQIAAIAKFAERTR